MGGSSPILGYETGTSSLEELDGVVLFRLARPSTLPTTIGISILMLYPFAGCIAFCWFWLSRIAEPVGSWHGFLEAISITGVFFVICVLLLAWSTRKLLALHRAGDRPFVLGLHERNLYVDDPRIAAPPMKIKSNEVLAIELKHERWSLPRTWELRIARDTKRQVKLEFVEADRASVEAMHTQLCASLGVNMS